MVKHFQVLYKFSDVFLMIDAKNEEEAQKIADNNKNMKLALKDTYCYGTEIEEME
jgi:hypothetical protein